MTKWTMMMLCGAALTMSAADLNPVARTFDSTIGSAESEIVGLAEAMPADKYDFAPSGGAFEGVRTFAEQAKHIAAVNYLVAAAAQGEKPPVDTNKEAGPSTVRTKEQVLHFLKGSFAYAHKAAAGLTAANLMEQVDSPFGEGKTTRGGILDVVAWHSFDHYGQMVVYARMNGVIPPASRK